MTQSWLFGSLAVNTKQEVSFLEETIWLPFLWGCFKAVTKPKHWLDVNASKWENFDGPELDELYIRFETCGALIQHDFIETRLDCWGQKELFWRWVVAMTCHPAVSDDKEQMLTLYSEQSSQTSCFMSFGWRIEIIPSVRMAQKGYWLWLFCHEFTHFLVPLLQAYVVWWCPEIFKYQVCLSFINHQDQPHKYIDDKY